MQPVAGLAPGIHPGTVSAAFRAPSRSIGVPRSFLTHNRALLRALDIATAASARASALSSSSSSSPASISNPTGVFGLGHPLTLLDVMNATSFLLNETIH